MRSLLRRLSLLLCLCAPVPFGAGSACAGQVDINQADATTLARELNGVGPKLAVAIVAHRKQHGPFRVVNDLEKVRGIGPKILEKNRVRLTVGVGR